MPRVPVRLVHLLPSKGPATVRSASIADWVTRLRNTGPSLPCRRVFAASFLAFLIYNEYSTAQIILRRSSKSLVKMDFCS